MSKQNKTKGKLILLYTSIFTVSAGRQEDRKF